MGVARASLLFLVFFLFCSVSSYVPVQNNMKSFSSAIKGGKMAANVEKVLYQRDNGQPGVVTEQWFTGQSAMNEQTRIRIYVDGEADASIDFMLFLGHGIGGAESDEVQNIPWGTRRIAHAADGGIYNTYRIPFSKSINITATHPKGGAFWYIVRGVENYPLVLGDLMLPADTKLKLYKNVDVELNPQQFLTVANISSGGGALFQVTLAAESTDYNYLEACFRTSIDGDPISFLSSGTEDFFLSAYYFNKGLYHLDNAGLTAKSGRGVMSAYKFFENDPLLFSKSFTLIWRCGETPDGTDGCPTSFPPPSSSAMGREAPPTLPFLAKTKVTTYAWVYQWGG